MLNKIKAWAWPLGRTFASVFLATLFVGLVKVDFANFHTSDINFLASAVMGAIGTAANVVILTLQKSLPGLPDPKPPVQ